MVVERGGGDGIDDAESVNTTTDGLLLCTVVEVVPTERFLTIVNASHHSCGETYCAKASL